MGEWFNTGDWYYRDAEGCFYRYGASDNMLNVGSIWMSPIEIESALVSHPAVLEVAVVAKEDEKGQSKCKGVHCAQKWLRAVRTIGKTNSELRQEKDCFL